jgi:hypothetical protein
MGIKVALTALLTLVLISNATARHHHQKVPKKVTPQVAVQVTGPVMVDSRDSGPLWWTVRRIDSGGVKKLVSEW